MPVGPGASTAHVGVIGGQVGNPIDGFDGIVHVLPIANSSMLAWHVLQMMQIELAVINTCRMFYEPFVNQIYI